MSERLSDRAVLAGPVIAGATLTAALAVALAEGLPLRDPGRVCLKRFLTAAAAVVLAAGATTIARRRRGHRAGWSRVRVGAAAIALVSFYVTYFAYRNLKSAVPVVRPGVLFDGELGRLDRNLTGGHQPGVILHDLLGRGLAAQVLSAVYMAFFAFIPLVLAVALGGGMGLRKGLLVATTLMFTWMLGAASYYVLPSLGPFSADPAAFAHLPPNAATDMQRELLIDRTAFLRAPAHAVRGQSIGAFASLHVAIYAATLLAARAVGASRLVLAGLAAATMLTAVSTIYFGWHYLADDAAGVLIAALSLWLARRAVGAPAAAAKTVAAVPEPA